MRPIRLLVALVVSLALAGIPLGAGAETAVMARTLEVLASGNPTIVATDVWRGTTMARESTGLAVASGAVVEARVVNGVDGVVLSLMTDSNQTDRETDVHGVWTPITAAADSGVFFKLRDASAWPVAPRVEYRVVSGTHHAMPEYRLGTSTATFLAAWDASGSPFAVVVDRSFSMLIPVVDRDKVRDLSWSQFRNLDHVIESYRHILATYDSWLGVDAADPSPAQRNAEQRYFMRPDRNGWGYAYYYSGRYVGTSEPSVTPYLQGPTAWVILHELGHGYDGLMTKPADAADIQLGEVWNNIYGYHYQTLVNRLEKNWLYEAGTPSGQATFDARRAAAGGSLRYADLDFRMRLDFVARIADLTGIDAFRDFNRTLRTLHASGQDPAGQRRSDLIAEHWGLADGVNLLPWFDSYGLDLSPALRWRLLDQDPATMALPLRDLVRDATALQGATSTLGLGSAGELVTTTAVRQLGLLTTARVKVDRDAAGVEGREVSLWDGDTLVATSPFVGGTATFPGLPIGTYTVRYPESRTTGHVPATDWLVAPTTAPAGGNKTVSYPTSATRSPAGGVSMRLLGLGDVAFASLTHDPSTGTLVLHDAMQPPHLYFGGQYAAITVTSPAGQQLYRQSFVGDAASKGPAEQTLPAAVGTTITVTHEEPGRLRSSDLFSGAPRADLSTAAETTTYVVSQYGIVKQGTVNALDGLLASLRAELASLEQLAAEGAYLAPRAAAVRASISALPLAQRDQLLAEYAALLDELILPATATEERVSPGGTPTPTPSPTPTIEPTPTPSTSTSRAPYGRSAPYTAPGHHLLNGRQWMTSCEAYSATERCRTEIWATVVTRVNHQYSIKQGWAFNNLTYLPFMTRQQWSANPLGHEGAWTAADGSSWRTECDTPATGTDACRSYRLTTVYSATAKPTGGYLFAQANQWVFNNIVMFGSYPR